MLTDFIAKPALSKCAVSVATMTGFVMLTIGCHDMENANIAQVWYGIAHTTLLCKVSEDSPIGSLWS